MRPLTVMNAQADSRKDAAPQGRDDASAREFVSGVEDPLSGAADAVRQVLGSLPDLVIVLDSELRVRFASRDIPRFTAREMEGMPVVHLLQEGTHATAVETMR